MSSRSDQDFLQDMYDASQRIVCYCSGINFDEFSKNTLIQDAVIRNLEILGEACKKVSSSCRADNPAFPWKNIAGMRDKLIHDYFGVNVEIVWDVVQTDLPGLIVLLREAGAV